MIEIRRSNERGHADFGWLDSRHTFSFGEYYDRRFMGFGHLRVINEDRVEAGAGFPKHGHANMEIVSYVVSGGLAHQDTLGTRAVLQPGDVQVMSAGRGIQHSEMNASETEPVHFLQIWLLPAEAGTTPRYEDKSFPVQPGLTLLVSPEGREGSLPIGQDTDLYRAVLAEGEVKELPLRHDRAYVQVVKGQLDVNGARLHAGDGASLTETRALKLVAGEGVEALVFDLR